MPDAGNAPADYPEGVVLLDTLMYYGEISYNDEDVQTWQQRWRPSEKAVQDLERDWRLIPVAKVLFISNGVGSVRWEVKPRKDGLWPGLCDFFTSCLRWYLVKIKACVIGCLWLICAMLILFYEWLRGKWQNRR